ncbi:TonB-dependent receptor [Novosphingobium lentum]|uniref:TonB-dependent receptor n=1 Tax=Novosphingobium lentum TaxID=145287 RepID=UPI00082C68F4|nr:TonB-dependent receptor [Novosphingobium lentum]
MLGAATIIGAPGLAHAGAATAATAEADPNDQGLKDIVVTARRSSENQQRTPVAVTAVSAAQIQEKQIVRLGDLTRTTPGFASLGGGTAGPLVANFSIRGQSQANPGSGNDSPVGIYIDGVYQARPILGNSGVLDLASAEVLRGPQGTLFGRNTTGGAINITTQAPKDAFEGYLKLGYGNYAHYSAEGVVNIPLSETVATRFAGRYEKRDGYVQNLTTGMRENDIKGNYQGRASLLWHPDSLPIKLLISGDFTDYRDNGLASVQISDDFGLGKTFFGTSLVNTKDDFYKSYSRTVGAGSYVNTVLHVPVGTGASGNPAIDQAGDKVVSKGINANLDIDFGAVHVKSITAYRTDRSTSNVDIDGSPARGVSFSSDYGNKQFSQEIQASGKLGELDWIVGAIYFQESGKEDTVSDQQFFGGNPFPFARDSTDYKSLSRGIFAQLNYHVTSNLRVTGGIRYTWDSRDAVRHGRNGGVLPDFSDSACAVVSGFVPTPTVRDPAGGCNDARGGKFSYPAWLASVDYQVSPVTFVYLKTSGASLAGGINFRATAPGLESIGPETVRDIEAGVKTDLFDRHVRLNLSAFHIWRSSLQENVNPIIAGRTTQFQINAGNARQYGGELESTILPWEGMELTGNVAYLHSKYVAGSFLAPTGVAATPFYDRSGEPVPEAPRWTWSIGATQTADVPGGKISLHADYSHISTFAFYANSFNPTNPALTPALISRLNDLGLVKGHDNMNARLTYNLAHPDIELAVWGQNLTQVKYYDAPFTGLYQLVGIATSSISAPRTYGVTATYRF